MKKILFVFAMLVFSVNFYSCTDTELSDDEKIKTVDPDKECPEWDRENCNGIPDDQE